MKKTYLIAATIIAIAAVVVFSMLYPPADESDTKGTFAKVDKYRNSTVSQNDIKLRSEFVKDTAALSATIKSLDFYKAFYTDLSADIKSWESSLSKAGVKDEKMVSQIKELGGLASFLDNNLKSVDEISSILRKFQTKEIAEDKFDIQNNLMNFGNFISNLNEKDKVIDSLFVNLNGYMDDAKLSKLVSSKEQANELKNVREKMLGEGFTNSYLMGNGEKLNLYMNSTIQNSALLSQVLFNKMVGLVNSQSFGNKEQLQLKNASASENLAGITFCSKILNASSFVQAKNQNNVSLDMVIKSSEFNQAFKNKPLGLILNTEQLGLHRNGSISEWINLTANKEQLGFSHLANVPQVFSNSSLGVVFYCSQQQAKIQSIALDGKQQLGAIN